MEAGVEQQYTAAFVNGNSVVKYTQYITILFRFFLYIQLCTFTLSTSSHIDLHNKYCHVRISLFNAWN